MKKLSRHELMQYGTAIISFLIVMTFTLLIFFWFVQQSVDKSVQNVLQKNTLQQKDHLELVLEKEYEFLESPAAYFGTTSDLFSNDNLQLLAELASSSSYHRLMLFSTDGIGRSSDGKKTDASSRDYFQKTLEGRRVISSPLSSSVDNETLVVLTVPVYDKDQNIIGVFGGSIDVTELTTMLFEDLYSGSGYSFITDSDGNIISIESTHNEIRENFFTSSSDWVFQTSEDGATLQEDFKQGHANCRKITADLSHARYISYQPLKYNDWMLCYIVPAVEARQHFAFINNFEIILFAFFICIVLLLIFALWKINQKNQTSLLRQAHTDALTGLLNKVYAEHTISEWLREKDFEDLQALMMIDMDYFKQINDTYGHATGDQVLKIFAGFLKEQFRTTDIIGRVGGDEFMILMKNVRLDYSIHLHLQKLYTNLQNIDIPELNGRVSAVLLLQRMLNLSASYTALLIMLCTQLSTTDVDVLLFTTISRTSRKPFYPDQRQEFWYRSIFLSFNLKIPAGQILYLSGGNSILLYISDMPRHIQSFLIIVSIQEIVSYTFCLVTDNRIQIDIFHTLENIALHKRVRLLKLCNQLFDFHTL